VAYKLMEAFVELTARGQARVLGALSTIQSRVDAFNERNKQLGALTAYAEQRGLKLAAEDAEKLVNVLGRGGGSAALDRWIDAQKASRRFSGELTESFKNFTLAATAGFAGATAAAVGFTAAASPAHMQTLTGSVQLLSASLGQVFLPVIEDVIDFLQDLAFWFHDLDPSTKETIATWVKWGAILLGVVVAGKAVATVLGLVSSFLGPLNAALRLAAAGFVGLGGAVKAAASGMAAFAAANPATIILGVVGAVIALAAAFGGSNEQLDRMVRNFEEMDALLAQIQSGGPLTANTLRQVFRSSNQDILQQLQLAQGNPARQRQILAEAERRLRERVEAGGTPEQAEARASIEAQRL